MSNLLLTQNIYLRRASPVAQMVKKSACNAGDPGLIPGSGGSRRRKLQPTPVFLPGKSHGQRSLVCYSPWGCKKSNTTERLNTFIYLCKIFSSEIFIRLILHLSKSFIFTETDMFFLAISMVGTDFSMIGQLFPHRARIEIKVK